MQDLGSAEFEQGLASVLKARGWSRVISLDGFGNSSLCLET